jgi:pimeloyl-ACP methyl ester carboxylesterase
MSAPTTLADFEDHRTTVATASGPVSVVDTGGGLPVAVLVHGVGTSSLLWRNLVPLVAGSRRCVAPDLPLHGQTPMDPDQPISLRVLADFVLTTIDAMGIDRYDLVANDTGGAVAQIVAASAPHRLRSLILTNCETHDNVPPKAFLPAVLAARAGLLARQGAKLVDDIPRARKRLYRSGYADVTALPLEIVETWVQANWGTPERSRLFERWIASLRADDLLAVEPELRRLAAPTLVVWGDDDRFFKPKWARWLVETIPGARDVTWIEGGRLFHPDERAADLAAALLAHWASAAGHAAA